MWEERPSSIRRKDLNWRPLEHESPPITSRPGLPPLCQLVKLAFGKGSFLVKKKKMKKKKLQFDAVSFANCPTFFAAQKISNFIFWTNENFFQQYLQFFLPFVNPKKLRTIFLSKMKRKKIKSIFRTKTFIAALSNSETHLLEKPNRKLGRLIKYKKKSNSFFEKDLPRSLFVYFRSFQTHILTEKSVSVS